DDIREGCNDVHRGTRDDRRCFHAARSAERECAEDVQVVHIRIVDFREAAEPCPLEIFRRPHPLAVIGELRGGIAARRRGADARGERDAWIILLFVALAARVEQGACDRNDEQSSAIRNTSCTFASWHAFSSPSASVRIVSVSIQSRDPTMAASRPARLCRNCSLIVRLAGLVGGAGDQWTTNISERSRRKSAPERARRERRELKRKRARRARPPFLIP